MKTVLTFGVWDLLHVGHVRFLTAARALGDCLVVGVPTDRVVRLDKGREPVIPFDDRMEMVRALRLATFVVPYLSLDFSDVIETFRPEILAVGEDWGDQDRHRTASATVERRGGKVVCLPRTPGVSTSAIIERIWRVHAAPAS